MTQIMLVDVTKIQVSYADNSSKHLRKFRLTFNSLHRDYNTLKKAEIEQELVFYLDDTADLKDMDVLAITQHRTNEE